MINTRLVNLCLISSGILTITFILIPELDINISNFFFSDKLGFIYKDNYLVKLIFRIIPILTKIFISICIIYMLYIFIKYKNIQNIFSSWAFFLVITASIGPGLTVNSLLKENFGRARPKHVAEFTGKKVFSPAFIISDQCNTNCSFSSGHAAMGFYFSAIAYVASNLYFTRIYLAGIVFGTLVGLSRIIMGGHFASDVVASCFIVLLLNHLVYLIWKRKKFKQIK